jgi:exonuclease SbcC
MSLRLQNIRSYVDETVGFTEGINLFEGDIGSGKSSILLAIEFGLFGLAEVASKSLLRHGEKEGGVDLVFEVKGRQITATRRLRRTPEGAQTRNCVISEGGKETKPSTTEMRRKVLELMEYGERRNPNAKLDIFRYTIFTPQEDMRTVLQKDKEMQTKRKNTLRRALDLDEYSQMATNLHDLRRSLDRDAVELGGMASGIDDVRSELKEAEREVKVETSKRNGLEKDLSTANTKAGRIRARLDKLEAKEQEQQKALHRVKDAESLVAQAEGELKELAARLEANQKDSATLGSIKERLEGATQELVELDEMEEVGRRLNQLRKDHLKAVGELERTKVELKNAKMAGERATELQTDLEELGDPGPDISQAKEGLEGFRSELAAMGHEEGRLKETIEGLEAEVEELTHLEGEAKCPKCQQPLTNDHLERLLKDNASRKRSSGSRLRELASKKNRLADTIKTAQVELEKLEGRSERRREVLRDLERAKVEAARSKKLEKAILDHEGLKNEEDLAALEASFSETRLAELRKLSGTVQELEVTRKELEKAVGSMPDLKRNKEEAQGKLDEATLKMKGAVKDHKKLSRGFDGEALVKARSDNEDAIKAVEGIRVGISSSMDLISRLERNAHGLSEKVVGLEGILERRAIHVHVAVWLNDRVIPAVEAMERSVMSILSDEMDEAAGKWFGHLVEDPDLVLSIDDNFIPAVAHQEYDMELNALSGGERTAAAFAYRLALNGLVRRNATPDQRNLLILDEPTDGFSREQLSRLGSLFAELDADQVIIVSHDRELRAFADKVNLVQKFEGMSTVTHVM